MDTKFMNSESNLSLTDYHWTLQIKLTQEKKINILLYQILVFHIHGKTSKIFIKTTDLKFRLQNGMKNLNCLMDHILYQDYFEYILKDIEKKQLILE